MLKFKYVIPAMGGVLAAFIFLMRMAVGAVDPPSPSPWLSVSNLNWQKQADVSAIANPGGNIDCYSTGTSPCIFETNYGEADTSGAVRLRNSSAFYPVYSQIDNRRHIIGIPNSDGFLSYTTEPAYGAYLYYNFSFINSIKLVTDGTSYNYQAIKPPDGKIVNQSQIKLAADTASIGFSENADWMVFSSPNVGLYRINLRTLESTQFAPGFNYTIGLSPAPQTAITNDGRYAAVASKDFNSFKIYDLSTCSGTTACQSRDLYGFTQRQISNFYAVTSLRLINDDTLDFYASAYSNGKYSFARYITSPSEIINRQELLGLGDSYISGEGEFEYLPGTDTDNNKCHLSPVSYPLLLGSDLNFNSYHSMACSGATTNDIINVGTDYGGQISQKVKRKNRTLIDIDLIISEFQPGYIDQLDFVKQYQPKSIILSVGGNDVNMIGKLKACISPGTCYSTYEDRLEFVKDVDNVFPVLVNTYQKLKAAGPPDMRVYVAAYPQIALPGGDCALNVHLNNDEVVFTTQAISYLDSVIKAAAAKAGVIYVDTQLAFDGHRFCEAGPGSVAINGVTAGNDIPDRLGGPIGSESFHPNQFGHQLLENKILALTSNISLPMPASDPAANLPASDDSGILNAPKSGRAINLPEYDPGLAPDLAYAGTTIDILAGASSHSLAAATNLSAQLHSTPISLGQFATDTNGNLSARLTIPADTPAGNHTLHFYGTDMTGQPIDIYKDIYIAKTADDLDGNGINDSAQSCVGIEPSGQDYDIDGIDDSCDSNISQPLAPAVLDKPTIMNASVSGTVSSSFANTNSSSALPPAEKTPAKNDQTIIKTGGPAPKVLSASTVRPAGKKVISKDDNLYIKPKYYAAGGAGFLALSTVSYFFKRRWF